MKWLVLGLLAALLGVAFEAHRRLQPPPPIASCLPLQNLIDSVYDIYTFHPTHANVSRLPALFAAFVDDDGVDLAAAAARVLGADCATLEASKLSHFDSFYSLFSLYKRHFYAKGVERRQEGTSLETVTSFETVVVGGGSAGLAASLVAYRSGATRVILYEKRMEYTRTVWFDLFNRPYSHAISWLHRLGLFCCFAPPSSLAVKVYNEPRPLTAVTLRCLLLERLLSLAAFTLGIEMRYGVEIKSSKQLIDSIDNEYDNINNNNDNNNNNNNNNSHMVVIIVADGSQSRMIATQPFASHFTAATRQTRFPLTTTLPRQHSQPPVVLDVPSLSQTTIIANFRTVSDGDEGGGCPSLRRDADDAVLDSRLAAFFLPSLSLVFKRFYYNDCHLQIFFTERGREGMGEEEEWRRLVFDVVRILFRRPPPSLAALAASLDGPIERVDVSVDAMMNENTVILESERRRRRLVVVVVGDALFTAFYRLGVGINAIFDVSSELSSMFHDGTSIFHDISGQEVWEAAVRRKQRRTRRRVAALVDYQLRVMFLESHCDIMTMFDIDNEGGSIEKDGDDDDGGGGDDVARDEPPPLTQTARFYARARPATPSLAVDYYRHPLPTPNDLLQQCQRWMKEVNSSKKMHDFIV